MLVRNISDKPWRWPFTEDGTPDRVEPGELYEIDVRISAFFRSRKCASRSMGQPTVHAISVSAVR